MAGVVIDGWKISRQKAGIVNKSYFNSKGQFHREDGPAFECEDRELS